MKNFIIAVTIIVSIVATSCSNTPGTKKNVPADGKIHKIAKQYTCTMHPAVIANKPGICTKCGMDLVEKK